MPPPTSAGAAGSRRGWAGVARAGGPVQYGRADVSAYRVRAVQQTQRLDDEMREVGPVATARKPTAAGSLNASHVGATIYSVAERAGVSIATVSRVLQGAGTVSAKTTQKVLDAVEELNYVPLGAARSLAVRHHEAHGLVLPELSGPYYSELLMGFESRAAELGQSVTLMLTDGKADLARAVRQLATHVDAIAVLGSAAMPPAVARALHGQKPVVIIAGTPQEGIESVRAENAHSAEQLTEHVLAHGRTR